MTKQKKVLHSNGDIEKFSPKHIKEQLLRETDISEKQAERIKVRVAEKIRKLNIDEISTATIRAEVSAQLTSRGLFEAEEDSRILGTNIKTIDEMLNTHIKDNANLGDNSETFYKYLAEKSLEQYTLAKLPDYISQAHTEGYIHIHDRSDFFVKPNCISHNIKWFLKNGLSCDGDIKRTAVAKPAKHLDVLVQHLLQSLMSSKIDLSGGQGFPLFNIYLSPLISDISDAELKQCLQTFLFGCNMSCVSKGEVVFSSIGLHPACPDYLYNEKAMSWGGKILDKTYGEFEPEAKKIFKILCELLEEGDGANRVLRFPNVLCHLRNEYMDRIEDELFYFCKFLRRYPTGYFVNDDMENGGGIRAVMGALSSDTPVMTNKGFKYPEELNIGDSVMTYAEDGSKEWNKIYNIIPKPAPEKIFKITLDNGYEFKVTDNHKLPTINGIVKSEDLEIGMELYNYIDEKFVPTKDLESEIIGLLILNSAFSFENQKKNVFFDLDSLNKNARARILNICKEQNYDYKVENRHMFIYENALVDRLLEFHTAKGIFPQSVWDNKNIIANFIKGLSLIFSKSNKDDKILLGILNREEAIEMSYALSYIGIPSNIYNEFGVYKILFGNVSSKIKIKSIELIDNNDTVYDLSIENNYNYVCGLGGIHSENCRTASNNTDKRFTWEENLLNTGNLAFHTLNLPLIAIESDNINDFYISLDKYIDIVIDSLIIRRKVIEKRLDNGRLPFLNWHDAETGERFYRIETTSLSIGYVGLNECILELTKGKYNIDTPDGIALGEEIIQKISDRAKEASQKTGYKFGCFSTPAESTAGRFAAINKKKYPKAFVNGKPGEYYLTNSHHIDVSSGSSILDHIKNADRFHKIANFGSILHVFLGEAPDVDSLILLTKKIKSYNVGFWAYTLDFSLCEDCQTTALKRIDECPNCGSNNIMTWSRISGYYVPLNNWNAPKLAEFKDRERHSL